MPSQLVHAKEKPQKAPLNFWKVCHISNDEMVKTAQTGDIVLFTGKQMSAQILRGLINSNYDHVGVLVKYPNGQLMLFESLQGKGVCRWDWDSLTKGDYCKDNYSKIVYRRLIGAERDEEFKNIVQEFMIDTLGKKYRVNASALISNSDKDDHLKKQVKKKAGFFCSELVATLLKQLNLLDLGTSSSNYWPGSFSTESPERELTLLGDAFYSEELTVDFQM